jgi:hypothetical protein
MLHRELAQMKLDKIQFFLAVPKILLQLDLRVGLGRHNQDWHSKVHLQYYRVSSQKRLPPPARRLRIIESSKIGQESRDTILIK